MKRLLQLLLALLAVPSAYGACTGGSPTWTTTPDSASVQTCINSATAGDVINVSAGTATWTGANAVVLAKAITLSGAGPTTIINLDGSVSQIFHITKQTTGVTRIKNFKFSVTDSGAKATPHTVVFDGPWPTGQPIVFTNNTIQLAGSDFSTIATPGGVIMANNTIHGTNVGDTLAALKLPSDNTSWTTTGSLGTLDSTGWMNTYIETNFFDGGANATDCDDECRVVFRFNTGQTGGTFNSHGADTSPQGMRQFEIYNNNLTLPDKSCPGGNVQSPSNINQWLWIRGGSGVIYNNQMEPLVTGCWGTKNSVKLANRGAENNFRPSTITSCSQVTYPAYHQIGQDFNTALFTNPISFWGNTTTDSSRMPNGLFIDVFDGWMFGDNCNFDWNTFWQWGRDGVNTSLTLPIVNPTTGGDQEGQGGTPRAGYTAFTYPHPLVAPSTPAPVLSFSPATVAFGNQAVASITSQTLTISNVGNATETFSSIVLTPSQFTNGNTGLGGQCAASGTILQGASCTVLVKFQPTAVTSYSGTLTMNGTVTAAASLTGSGTSSVSIPAVPTGLTAGVAGSTVNLSWTASTGTPTGYNVLRGATSGSEVTVATLGNVTTYADTGRANGTYFYKVNAFNSAGTSANSSEVSATVSTACSLTLTPSFLTLPNTVLGATSASTNFALTNNGTASCTSVSVATPSGANAADFSRTNGCSATITVLGTCNVAVTFTPSLVGVENAAIVITSNDPTSPDTETLQGTGTVAVNVSPTSINFGRVNPNKVSTAHVVTFTNTSGGTVTLSAAIATGDTTQFTKGADTCTPTVADGASCTVSLTFTPTTAGNKASALVFTYTGAPGSPISVPLSGQSTTHKVRKGVLL